MSLPPLADHGVPKRHLHYWSDTTRLRNDHLCNTSTIQGENMMEKSTIMPQIMPCSKTGHTQRDLGIHHYKLRHVPKQALHEGIWVFISQDGKWDTYLAPWLFVANSFDILYWVCMWLHSMSITRLHIVGSPEWAAFGVETMPISRIGYGCH